MEQHRRAGVIADVPTPSPPRQRREVAGGRRRIVITDCRQHSCRKHLSKTATFGFVPEPIANPPAVVAPVNPVAAKDSFDIVDHEAPINPLADEATAHPFAAVAPVNAAAVPLILPQSQSIQLLP